MLYKNDAARLSFNRMNVGPSYLGPRHADHSWNEVRWYDGPREDPAWPEVHTYTNAISYLPGEEVVFHSSTTASVWTLAIVRDGLHPVRVHLAANLPGHFTAAPKDAYSHGCGWPAAHRWRIPEDAPSGFYRVEFDLCPAGRRRFRPASLLRRAPDGADDERTAAACPADLHMDGL